MRITREDAFKILGVNEDSSSDEIRSCYKKLALKWHPDKHGDSNVSKDEATMKFQEVSAAYKRLTTNMNDADDEIDDNDFMNIREMMELFARIFFHNGVRCPHHGMDCCDYDEDEYFYSDEEYYTDEESEDEFLDSIAQRLRNKYEQRKYQQKDRNSQQHDITEEEALQNARELIEEEEQAKQKGGSKKQSKKKKKKGKKKKEKTPEEEEEEEKKNKEVERNKKAEEIRKLNNVNINLVKNGKNNIADEKPVNETRQQNGGGKHDTNTLGKKSRGNEPNKKNPNSSIKQEQGKKDNTKTKNMKNKDVDEDIDTNSAFFARAASKAPTTNNTNHKENHTTNHKKKKNDEKPPAIPSSTSRDQHNSREENSKSNNNNNNKKKINSSLSTSSSTSSSSNTAISHHQNTKNNNTQQPQLIKTNSSVSHQKAVQLTNGLLQRDDLVLQSRQVAVKGNQLAQANDYTGAVEMFTKAISLDPTDFRFFGNRSYCFDRLEKYIKALADSDAAIRLAPEWPKGFFRKGRALTGLKRFQEAEQVFEQVLKLDPVCEDAHFELVRVRVQILIDMGFTPSLSEQAVRNFNTVQQALEALLAGKISDEEGSDEVYFSEEEEELEIEAPPVESPAYHTVQNNTVKKNTNKPKAPPKPKCTALWVGNVDPELITEKQMGRLFGQCGKVASVRMLPEKYCAFVNFVNPGSALIAMEKLQGYALGTKKLLLRFPNNPPTGSKIPEPITAEIKQQPTNTLPLITTQQQSTTSPSVSESSAESINKACGPVNGNECYFWRTTGCVFESQCRYRHVRGHKGVDLPRVQAKYGMNVI